MAVMIHRLVLAVIVASTSFALAACGPDEPPGGGVVRPPPTPPPAVSSDFNGRWSGDAVVCAPGQGCVTNAGVSFVISVSGQTLTASGFCPDGSGVLTVTGQHGRSLSWSGSIVCEYSSPACATTRNEYVNATLALDSSNTLSLVAYANLTGCGYSFATTTTFTGRK